ncbi:MAG: hypothetical protein CUN56_09120 [Phototrophicales bacterium]|nr:MAG: hypothetical protein CUN56_09120 [Phototrophicales bacterium]RMG69785.1 MAG: hypothetical protein D6711_18875 [Chloroflexota bacterium]
MFKTVAYGGWQTCYQLSNGTVELIVTGDVGPRIIHFGFVGGENEFFTFENQLGLTGGDTWRLYGGHRLWHAPEAHPRTYVPDNQPITAHYADGVLHVVQQTEPLTGIQKQLWIALDPHQPKVTITHRLTNYHAWDVQLAPWALTVMAQGGTAVIPLPPRAPHDGNLLPKSSLALWAYTDLSDSRWTFGKQYILLRQQADSEPQKVGMWVPDGWLAYVRNGHLFIKTFDAQSGKLYPDMGSNAEIYTDHAILELESLAPLTVLSPGEYVEHVETWMLYDGVNMPQTDEDVIRQILPYLG